MLVGWLSPALPLLADLADPGLWAGSVHSLEWSPVTLGSRPRVSACWGSVTFLAWLGCQNNATGQWGRADNCEHWQSRFLAWETDGYLSTSQLPWWLLTLNEQIEAEASFFWKRNFYWSIVDLQCWINFCYIAKWLNYTHTYILFYIVFLYGLP